MIVLFSPEPYFQKTGRYATLKLVFEGKGGGEDECVFSLTTVNWKTCVNSV